LTFARLLLPSLGIIEKDRIIVRGPSQTGIPHLFATNGHGWREITPPHPFWLADADFLNPSHGWVVLNDCGGRAFVDRTNDGGRTWATTRVVGSVTCAAGSGFQLDFVDRLHGFLLANVANAPGAWLSATSDGGAHWRLVAKSGLGSASTALPVDGSMRFTSRRDGWLVGGSFGDSAGLYATEDGGRSWQRRTLPHPRGWAHADLTPQTPTMTGKVGVLAAQLATGYRYAVAFYSTSDGGRTWRVRSVRRAIGARVVIVNPRVWWVVNGTFVGVWVTTDGGRSWRTFRPAYLPGPYVQPVSLNAVSAHKAWLYFSPSWSRTAVYATTDGGRSWRRLKTPTT
jgi:photosystem II stability/assembly factor-like uncharacterized protein